MTILGKIHYHLNLVRRMGRATGVDLSAALHQGAIDEEEWSQMVTNCRGCACAGTCEAWLSKQALSGDISDAPQYCENAATFGRLSRAVAD